MAQDVQEPKPKKDWSRLFTRHIPTPMERLQGIGYGVASGAAQAMGGTVEALGLITEQGAKALGQDETPFSEGVQAFGRSISAMPEGMRPAKPRATEGLAVEAAQAVGSGVGFAAQTLAGGGLLRLARFAPQAAAWVAGGGTGILGNFASGYNDALAETGNREAAGWAYQQALDRGESPQQAMIAYGDVLRQTGDRTKALQSGWLNGTISGPLEVVGLGGVVGKVLGNADDATGGSISKAILKMVTEEGGQEGFAQLVENVGAYLAEYDEDRALFEGVAKSVALGGLAGGIVGGPLEVASRLMAAKESGPSGDQGDVQGPPSEGREVLRPEDAQVATNEMLKAQGLAIQAKPTSAATEEEREAAAYFERRGGQAVFVDQPADGTKVHPAYYHRPTRTAVFARGGPEGSIRKRFRIHEMGHHLAEVSRGHWQELGKALTELDPQGVAEQREAIRPDYEGLTPEAFEEEVVTTYLEDRGGLLLEGDKFEALARKPGLLRTVVDAIIRQLNRIPGIKIEERTTAALRRLRDQLAETDLERGIDPTLLPAMSATVRAGLDAIVGRAQPAQQAQAPAGQPAQQPVTMAPGAPPAAPELSASQAQPVDHRGPTGPAAPTPVRSPSAADPQLIRAQRKEREARKADLAASIYKAAGKPEKASQMAQEAARRRGPQRGETARRAQPTRAQAAVEAYEAGAEGGFAVDRLQRRAALAAGLRQQLDEAYEQGAEQSVIDALETRLERAEGEDFEPTEDMEAEGHDPAAASLEEMLIQRVMLADQEGLSDEQLGAGIRSDGDMSVISQLSAQPSASNLDLAREARAIVAARRELLQRVRNTSARKYSGAYGAFARAREALRPTLPAKIARHLTKSEKAGMRSDVVESVVKTFDGIATDRKTIRALAELGAVKRGWYARAAAALKTLFGDDAARFVGVLSATSPQQKVRDNLRMTFRVWDEWLRRGRPTEGDFSWLRPIVKMGGRMSGTEESLVTGRLERELKVGSFNANLLGDLEQVTLDTWMAKAFQVAQQIFGTKAGYTAFTAMTRAVAKDMGWAPAEVQETVWSGFMALVNKSTGRTAAQALEELTVEDVMRVPEFIDGLLADPVVVEIMQRNGMPLASIEQAAAATQPGQRVAASMPERVKARLSQMAELERPRQNFTLAAAVGFGSGAPRNATHAAYLSLPYEAQAAVTSEVASEAVEMVAKLINADLVVGSEGPGGWKNFPAEPSISMKLAGSRNLVEDAAAALGYLLEQSAVYVENVSPNGDTVFVDITGPGLDSYDTLRRFWGSLVEAAPELATGYHPIEAGLRTMRPTGESKADLSRFLRIADTVARKHGLDLSLRDGRAFTTQLDNDWTENPDGRSYLSRLVRRFGPGVQAGLVDRRRRLDGALAASIARHQPAGATAGSSDGAFAFWRRTGRLPSGIRGDVVLGRTAGRNRVSFDHALSGQIELAAGDFASFHENYTERAKPRESDLGVGKSARTLGELGAAVINSPYIERHQALVVRDGVVVAHAVGALGAPDAAYVLAGPALQKAFARGSFREGDVLVFAHNHPSGGFAPSTADEQSAATLTAMAEQMFGMPRANITHVVVGYGRATEFGGSRLFGVDWNMPAPAWRRVPSSVAITDPSALQKALRNVRPAPGTFVVLGTNNAARPVGLVAFKPEEAVQPDFDERMHEALIHMGAAGGFALVHQADRSVYTQLPGNIRDIVVVGEDRSMYRGGMQPNRMFNYALGRKPPKAPLIPAGAFAVTRTPEFQRWFAGSKVVDEQGEPLVVYHGTTAEFTEFGNAGGGEYGRGYYFAPRPESATMYGGRDSREGLRVLPVFLRMKNPFIADASTGGRDRVRALGQKKLRAMGHDGVIGVGLTGERQFVVFDPEQIKSATGNRGTFDPQDPDIRFAVPPERRQAARERVRALQQQAFEEGEGTSIGNDPAPVRAKPTADPQERAMWRGVDAWRDENDRLIRISHDEQEERAERGLRDARQSTEAAIRGALSDGDAGRILEPWEMVAAAKLVQERMRDAFQAAPGAARDAAYSDALELADAVRANRARTAQALGIFQDALSSPREQLVDAITAPQAEGARKMREQREKAKRGATLTERERARKELEKVQRTEAAKARKIADALQKAGLHPEQLPESELADLEVQAEIMRVASSSVSSATSKLKEWRYASMLSALLTHKANVVGNAIYNSIGHVERVAEAAVNLAVRAPDAAQAGELVPYFTSFFHSFGKAGSNFMRSWRTERDAWEMHLQETGRAQAEGVRLDLWGGPAIPGKLGRVVRAPLRALKAEDAFFKTLVGLPEAQAQAYRVAHSEGKRGRELTLRMQEILADPAHSIWSKVQEEVLRRTFQKPGDPKGSPADKLLWVILKGRGIVPGGDFVLPFVTTPFRIFEEAFGLAFAPGILAGKALVWPKTYGKNKAQLARDTARALLSSAVGLALLSMLNGEDDEGRPLVTGTRPSSRGEADLAYRTVPPYHIKVLGEYRDYSRLEPLATILASLVDTAKAAKDDPARGPSVFFRSVYEQMGDKTFLQTIGDVQDALERPSGRAGVELVRDTFITPMFPNIARQTAREMDPFFRQEEVWPMDRKATSTARAAVESLPYAILPARGIAPPIRYDLWGRPSQKFDPNVSPLGRYVGKIVNPFPGSTLPEVHALDRVISRFNERVDAGELVGMDDTVGKHFSKTAPDTTTTVAGQPVFFTPTEYARLQEVAGKRASERLLELLAKRRINAENPTERDMNIIDQVINQSRQQVRSEILAARGLPVAKLKAR